MPVPSHRGRGYYAGLGPDQLPKSCDVSSQLKLKLRVENPEDFVRRTFVLPAQDPESNFGVDLVFSESEYEKEALKRVRQKKVGETLVNFISPEDLIIQKIVPDGDTTMTTPEASSSKTPASTANTSAAGSPASIHPGPGLLPDLCRNWPEVKSAGQALKNLNFPQPFLNTYVNMKYSRLDPI